MADPYRTTGKDGHIYWQKRVFLGRGPDGKIKQPMITAKTKAELTKKEEVLRADFKGGTALDARKTTLHDYLTDWLDRRAKRVRPGTIAAYRYQAERYILPRIGGYVLAELNPATLRKWLESLDTADKQSRNRRILHAALADAVTDQLLPANPLVAIRAMQGPKSPATALTEAEVRDFERVASQHHMEPFWSLMLYLPVRPSEIRGLTWASINLEQGTLEISAVLAAVASKSYPGRPKNDSSARTLDLAPDVLTVLKAAKASQRDRRAFAGHRLSEHDHVVVGPTGEPIPMNSLRYAFTALLKKAGVRHVRIYDLRHTAITRLLDAGVDVKVVAELAGHSDIRTTLSIYRHTNREQKKAALAVLSSSHHKGLSEPVLAAH